MKKLFSELEKEHNMFARDTDKYSLDQKLTKEEFMDILLKNLLDFSSCNYDDRVEFLRKNKYEVTRENLFADLSSKS